MRVAFVKNGIIENIDILFPGSARRLDTLEYVNPVNGLAAAPVVIQEACGYYIIQENPAPVLAANQRADYSIVLVVGRPVQQWTIRNETPVENIQRTRSGNSAVLKDIAVAQNFIVANEAYLTWFNQASIQTIINGTGNLTAAQLSEAIRRLAPQLERLTKGINKLTRLSIADALLDSTQSS